MRYFDGFVLAVPTANKHKFIAHAERIDPVFLEHGAIRVVECWGEDVPHGKQTDFHRAVQAKDDESIAFSWIEWPDKGTRDAGMAAINAATKTDPRMSAETNPAPFDGQRMIFGGFQAIVEEGAPCASSYVQGFMIPVPDARKEDYRDMAQSVWSLFEEFGATRVIEAWGDDVSAGKVTDFARAVEATGEESVVFSFLEWSSREACDAAAEKMQDDERMAIPEGFIMPFDGKRMVWGGFSPVVVVES